MKKNILKVAVVAVIALTVGLNVYNSQKEELPLSDLMMDNVEALAQSEGGEYGTLYSNGQGNRFCCCPGGTKTCDSSKCANCPS